MSRGIVRQPLRYILLLSFAAVVVVAIFLAPVAAAAQDLNSRISRIENEIQTLSRAVFKGESPPPGALAPAGSAPGEAANALRLQQIEMELQYLTGKVEQQNFELRQYQDGVAARLAALEARLAAIEGRRGFAGSGGAAADVTAAPAPYEAYGAPAAPGIGAGLEVLTLEEPAAVPGEDYAGDDNAAGGAAEFDSGQLGTLRRPADVPPPPGADVIGTTSSLAADEGPVDHYERAFSLLRDRNYESAAEGFSIFLTRYPSHELAANARYWLGETHYVRGDFETAARIFAEAYQLHPKGPKGPDNLLKLAMSLEGMGKTADACLAYGQVAKEYPVGAQPILTRAEKEMEKLGCVP